MGLDLQNLRALTLAKRTGVNFAHTAMIGRQELHMSVDSFIQYARSGSCVASQKTIDKFTMGDKYVEPYLQDLGAEKIDSIDFSDYEEATCLIDMGKAVPESFHQKFDFLWDGGSLEHIFEFPTALRNSMNMVRVGGHLLICTMANNFCGHGFYQFSPELFYRCFSHNSGYQVEWMFFATAVGRYWYAVDDPQDHRGRVLLSNASPTYLFALAKRIKEESILDNPVYQSDYSDKWSSKSANNSDENNLKDKLEKIVRKQLPINVVQKMRSIGIPFSKKYFHKVNPDHIL